MAKPGVMFYFDIRPCIRRLTLEEKGKLFEAILDYGEFGTIPEVDGTVGVAWDFIQQRLNRDTLRYDDKVEQTKYAVSVRDAKKKGIQLPPLEKWRLLSEEDRERLLSDDNERYPTTTTTTTSTTASTTTGNKESVADKPPKPAHISPPSVDDVRAYCGKQGYTTIDPERFVSYYAARQWMAGQTAITDWRAAVDSWHRKDMDKNGNGKTEPKPAWTVGTVV